MKKLLLSLCFVATTATAGQLPVADGIICPTELPIVEGAEYVEVTMAQHGAIFGAWTGEEPQSLQIGTGLVARTESHVAACNAHPGMAQAAANVEAYKEQQAAKADAMIEGLASIGNGNNGNGN